MTVEQGDQSHTINAFYELVDYVNILGEHVNQIFERLENIEDDVEKIIEEFDVSVADNNKEKETIKRTMISKSEFNEILQKLKQPFEKLRTP